MADIDHKEAIDFSNAVVRVLCEQARDFEQSVDDFLQAWNAGMKEHFPDVEANLVIDKRQINKVSQLTGKRVNDVARFAATIQTEFKRPGIQATVYGPCVRTRR